MVSQEFLNWIKQVNNTAIAYADLLMDYGGAVYHGPYIDPYDKSFKFAVGPATHGMSRWVELPLSILDTPERLEELADNQKKKWREENERSRCKTCGHINLPNSIDILC